MNQAYIEVSTYEGDGYQPVIDYQTWRVAILNYCEELEVENLRTMQKHMESDEVFVLLKGNCVLFSGGQADNIGPVEAIRMEPLKLYNVKRGVWHTHTLDRNGMVLIVENQNTSDLNSPTNPMSQEQLESIIAIFNEIM